MLTAEEKSKLDILVQQVNEQRKIGVKCRMELEINAGHLTVYHLGQANPTIRIDFKINE